MDSERFWGQLWDIFKGVFGSCVDKYHICIYNLIYICMYMYIYIYIYIYVLMHISISKYMYIYIYMMYIYIYIYIRVWAWGLRQLTLLAPEQLHHLSVAEHLTPCLD